MPVGHGIMVRGGVAGRSTSIPVFGVLALLLATAARLPRTIGLRHRKSIRPRSIPDHRRDQRAQAGAADNQGPRGRPPTAGIGVVPADDAAATPTGVDGVVVARVRPGSRAERAGLRGANADSGAQGDIITAANGVAVRSPFDLTHQLERVGIGGTVDSPSGVTARRPTMAVDVVDEPQRQ
jgi:S1-C subfamily serine protease